MNTHYCANGCSLLSTDDATCLHPLVILLIPAIVVQEIEPSVAFSPAQGTFKQHSEISIDYLCTIMLVHMCVCVRVHGSVPGIGRAQLKDRAHWPDWCPGHNKMPEELSFPSGKPCICDTNMQHDHNLGSCASASATVVASMPRAVPNCVTHLKSALRILAS